MLVIVTAPGRAQSPESELLRADALISDSRYDEAMSILEGLSRDNPGTSVDGRARMSRAYILGAVRHDMTGAQALYESVIGDFPLTYGAVAESNTLEMELVKSGEIRSRSPEFQLYLEKTNPIVQRVGGPDILASPLGPVRPVAGLDPELQKLVLFELLDTVASRLENAAHFETPRDLVALRRGITLSTYTFNLAPERLTPDRARFLRWSGLHLFGLRDDETEEDTFPPTISPVSPVGRLNPGNEPTLQLVLADGDVQQQQPDLLSTKVHLDGGELLDFSQGLPDGVALHVTSNTENTVGPFLTYTITCPLEVLAPGVHRFDVSTTDLAGNPASTSWTFEVLSASMLTVQLNVLSKHVKPHKNEQARVQATATNPPTDLSYSIYRAGQGEPPQGPPVLTAQGLPAPNGALELVWDGTDASGQRVANGSYVMVVTARDSTGHEASDTAHLVVNFQGGAQGARSLWQLASPVQHWLFPDALRLAFPIPCLGAELAGNYLFSPEQLSSTVHRQRAEL